MIAGQLLEVLFSFALVVICISYMLLGCAGHKKKTGDEDSQMPTDGESNAATGGNEIGPSKMEQEGSRANSQAGESIAGYQSQTSEILAGPGEEGLVPSRVGSVLSRASGSSHASSSKLHSSTSSHVGSTLSSNAVSSSAANSKFGSTLDSGFGSRVPGAGSVLSMLSRSGNNSNIQSTLSSNAGGVSSNIANSNVQSSRMASNLDSGYGRSRHGHSHVGHQSILSATSNMGRGGGPASRYSHLQSSQAGGQSAIGSNLSANVGSTSMRQSGTSAVGSNLSGAISSAVQISGSTPVSTSRSAASSPSSSTRSVTTPTSQSSHRSSAK